VPDTETKRFGALPSAIGVIARLAYARAKEAGADTDLLLKNAGITRAQIEDPAIRLNVRDQIRFLNLAADALQDDLLGYHLARSSELREMGLLYYVAASSDTLSHALQHAARYSAIVNEGVALQFGSNGEAGITFRYIGVSRHLDRHQMEFFAATTVRISRQLTGQRVIPIRVGFTHHRDTASAEFAEFLGDNVGFGAAVDEVAFAPSTGDLPIIGADPYLNRLLVKYCEEALAQRPANLGSFRSAVENAIVPLLPHGQAEATEIARSLGVSQRTLARRLRLEDVTFSQVLDNLKSDLAQRYLADASLSISQIAWLLGYQEVSAFTHAFKRWTGMTPRDARARMATNS
jgi:AraC-like DNA-binding protein